MKTKKHKTIKERVTEAKDIFAFLPLALFGVSVGVTIGGLMEKNYIVFLIGVFIFIYSIYLTNGIPDGGMYD